MNKKKIAFNAVLSSAVVFSAIVPTTVAFADENKIGNQPKVEDKVQTKEATVTFYVDGAIFGAPHKLTFTGDSVREEISAIIPEGYVVAKDASYEPVKDLYENYVLDVRLVKTTEATVTFYVDGFKLGESQKLAFTGNSVREEISAIIPEGYVAAKDASYEPVKDLYGNYVLDFNLAEAEKEATVTFYVNGFKLGESQKLAFTGKSVKEEISAIIPEGYVAAKHASYEPVKDLYGNYVLDFNLAEAEKEATVTFYVDGFKLGESQKLAFTGKSVKEEISAIIPEGYVAAKGANYEPVKDLYGNYVLDVNLEKLPAKTEKHVIYISYYDENGTLLNEEPQQETVELVLGKTNKISKDLLKAPKGYEVNEEKANLEINSDDTVNISCKKLPVENHIVHIYYYDENGTLLNEEPQKVVAKLIVGEENEISKGLLEAPKGYEVNYEKANLIINSDDTVNISCKKLPAKETEKHVIYISYYDENGTLLNEEPQQEVVELVLGEENKISKDLLKAPKGYEVNEEKANLIINSDDTVNVSCKKLPAKETEKHVIYISYYDENGTLLNEEPQQEVVELVLGEENKISKDLLKAPKGYEVNYEKANLIINSDDTVNVSCKKLPAKETEKHVIYIYYYDENGTLLNEEPQQETVKLVLGEENKISKDLLKAPKGYEVNYEKANLIINSDDTVNISCKKLPAKETEKHVIYIYYYDENGTLLCEEPQQEVVELVLGEENKISKDLLKAPKGYEVNYDKANLIINSDDTVNISCKKKKIVLPWTDLTPAQPVKPVNPVNPVKPVKPVKPVNPAKPAKPAQKVDVPTATKTKLFASLGMMGATLAGIAGLLNKKKKFDD